MRVMTVMCLLLSLCSAPIMAEEPDWRGYAQVLRYIKQGVKNKVPLAWVDYAALKKSGELEAVYQQMSRFPVASLHGKKERLAFYINVYNILALRTVVNHWPLDSIKDVGHFFSPVWKKDAGMIGGMMVSLDAIENEKIRTLQDPRIHFAIVCASVSCPDLRNEPYTANKLEQQLDAQVQLFLKNPQKGLHLEGNTATVSKIFSWFEKDFKVAGGVEKFIRHYHTDLPRELSIDANLNYDWQLNGFK